MRPHPRRWLDERRHWRTIEPALDDSVFCRAVADGAPLPAGYGVGLSERVVEYPWLLGHELRGAALDAGSTLNHRPVLARVLSLAERLDIVTLAPERKMYPELSVSYLWADLRELPLRDGYYDFVVSLSTLEHVGMDTTAYGGFTERGAAVSAMTQAVRELRRVLRPGGRLYATVPYGLAEDFGWMRQFDRAALEELISAFGPTATEPEVRVFAYGPDGWRPSSPADAADARYRTRARERRPADGARAARAVAAIALTRS